jgi:hypothetical protein
MDRLGSPESLERFAQILYSTFREADRQLYDVLFVTPPIEKGLGNAICERLRKASQGR